MYDYLLNATWQFVYGDVLFKFEGWLEFFNITSVFNAHNKGLTTKLAEKMIKCSVMLTQLLHDCVWLFYYHFIWYMIDLDSHRLFLFCLGKYLHYFSTLQNKIKKIVK